MAAFRANGIVTLTTDFGLREPFVGIMKGMMLAHASQLRFIDMAHDVSAFQPVEAGFWLAGALRYFPAGTVHVAVVDPGVGTPRALLAAMANEQVLLAPDNGLLAPLAVRKKIDRIIRIDPTRLVQYGVSDVSATFHGRDVFAPLAAAIAAGRCDPVDLGEEVDSLDQSGWPATTARADGGVAGVVVAVDRFGNLISNIEATAVVALNSPTVHVGGLRLPLRRTYGEAAPGEYLGLINSFEVLEVARSRGNAAAGLGLAVGAPISAVPAIPGAQFRRS
ncbi:MAG TPA: SAM-dependent chlorinase/fluorinase [Steroidobacteraceae bacterium]|jgi:S-adenosylmethionine hydrolase|nr:SAM-dependent chlorinase/fluorinase [Steroidobacteraceae bacterium]